MASVAPLSHTDRFHWGLREQPTYDEMLQSVKKPLRIPIPDRAAKWYGLSVYRSFLLDQAKKYHDYEHMRLDFDQSGAELPQTAAAVHPSDSGQDRAWSDVDRFHDALEEQHEYERAFEMEEAGRRAETAETRRQQLSTYGPVQGHWATEAHRRELEEAGVPHMALVPRTSMPRAPWSTAHQIPTAAGQIGGRPFPTFEQLNYGQQRPRPAALSSTFNHRGYERLRDEAVGR